MPLTAWFYDAVYDPRSPDNEASSAEPATQFLCSGLLAQEVERLVLLAAEHSVEPGMRAGPRSATRLRHSRRGTVRIDYSVPMTKSLTVAARNDRVLIGARLRAARLRLGLTLDDLAIATGTTKGFLSRVERDAASPSVATLVTVCAALSLPVSALFEVPQFDVVRHEEGLTILLIGEGAHERLLTPPGQDQVQMIRSVIEPGGSAGQDLYTLNSAVQVVHVLSGLLEVTFSDGRVRLAKGDTMTFAGREPHTWRNPQSARRSEAIWVLSPASWRLDS